MADLGKYQINNCYAGQSEELMLDLPDECIDLTVCSPPYGEEREYDGFELDWRKIIKQLYRITKPGGVAVWVVADTTTDTCESLEPFKQALYAVEMGFNNETMIFKPKGTGAKGSNYLYLQAFEFMFVWIKGKPKTYNLIRDRKNKYSGTTVSIAQHKYDGRKKKERVTEEYGRRTNIWEYNVGHGNGDDKTDHPAPFCEALAQDHILTWSNPGDIVFDPFMGSGTTAKMAKLNNRNYLGFDKSPNYIDNIITPRLRNTGVKLF